MSSDDMIDAHLAWCAQAGRSERTITERRWLLRRLDAELPYGLDAADETELRAWLYRPAWAANSRAAYRAHIRAFFRWATDPDDPWIDLDPSRRLPAVQVERGLPRPVTDAELRAILALPAPLCWYAVLAAFAGLRAMEIAAIAREDITEQVITIRRGKGRKPAMVPTHPLIWAWLSPLPPGPIMPDGPEHRAKVVSARMAAALHALGIDGGIHRLRHTFGTELYRRTHDLRLVQELMRHSRPETTAVYTLISDDRRRAGIAALAMPAA